MIQGLFQACPQRRSRSLFSVAVLGGLGFLALIAEAGEFTPYVLGPDDEIMIRAMDAEEIPDKDLLQNADRRIW